MKYHIFEWIAGSSILIAVMFLGPVLALIYGIGLFVGVGWGSVMKDDPNIKSRGR